MMRIYDTQSAQQTILRRPAWDELSIPDPLLDRIEALFGERISPDEAVRRILLREPTTDEARRFEAYAAQNGLAALCRVLFNTNEFLFVN